VLFLQFSKKEKRRRKKQRRHDPPLNEFMLSFLSSKLLTRPTNYYYCFGSCYCCLAAHVLCSHDWLMIKT
jgi:hypothetical protein